MSIKRKNSFSSFDYKEEKATRTYLEVRNRFDLVLHNNLNFVIILSDFHLKAPLKDPPKSSTHKKLHNFDVRSILFCCNIFSLIGHFSSNKINAQQ